MHTDFFMAAQGPVLQSWISEVTSTARIDTFFHIVDAFFEFSRTSSEVPLCLQQLAAAAQTEWPVEAYNHTL